MTIKSRFAQIASALLLLCAFAIAPARADTLSSTAGLRRSFVRLLSSDALSQSCTPAASIAMTETGGFYRCVSGAWEPLGSLAPPEFVLTSASPTASVVDVQEAEGGIFQTTRTSDQALLYEGPDSSAAVAMAVEELDGSGGIMTLQTGNFSVATPLTSLVRRVEVKRLAATTYQAQRMIDYSVIYIGPDYGAAVQAGITELATTGGELLVMPGAMVATSTVPAIPPGIPSPLVIEGYGATVTLASGAKAAFTFSRVGDGDVFKNFSIKGFTIDAANVTGISSVIFGVVGSNRNPYSRLSWKDITFQDITAINVPVDPTEATVLTAIDACMYQAAPDDTTSMETKNITIDNVKVYGGNVGFLLTASSQSGVPSNLHAKYSGIRILRSVVDASQGTDQVYPFFAGSHIHIGGWGYGDDVLIEDFRGASAGDDCIELNGFQNSVVRGSECVNPYNGAYAIFNQMNSLVDPSRQRFLCESCVARYNAQTNGAGVGWAFDHGDFGVSSTRRTSFGTATIRDSQFVLKGVSNPNHSTFLTARGAHDGVAGLRELNVDGLDILYDQDFTSSSQRFQNQIRFDADSKDWDGDGTADLPKVNINRLHMSSVVRKTSGTGVFHLRNFYITGKVDLSISNSVIEGRISGGTVSDDTVGMLVGQSTGTVFNLSADSVRFAMKGPLANGSPFLSLYGATNVTVPRGITLHSVNTTGTSDTAARTDISWDSASGARYWDKFRITKPAFRSLLVVSDVHLGTPIYSDATAGTLDTGNLACLAAGYVSCFSTAAFGGVSGTCATDYNTGSAVPFTAVCW